MYNRLPVYCKENLKNAEGVFGWGMREGGGGFSCIGEAAHQGKKTMRLVSIGQWDFSKPNHQALFYSLALVFSLSLEATKDFFQGTSTHFEKVETPMEH